VPVKVTFLWKEVGYGYSKDFGEEFNLFFRDGTAPGYMAIPDWLGIGTTKECVCQVASSSFCIRKNQCFVAKIRQIQFDVAKRDL